MNYVSVMGWGINCNYDLTEPFLMSHIVALLLWLNSTHIKEVQFSTRLCASLFDLLVTTDNLSIIKPGLWSLIC